MSKVQSNIEWEPAVTDFFKLSSAVLFIYQKLIIIIIKFHIDFSTFYL
jgi:hypothetical protein